MKGLKNHMGDSTHSNIDSLIVQSKLQEMMKMAGGGMIDKKIPGYMGGGMMKKKKGAYGYQEGGKVLYDIGSDFDKKNISQAICFLINNFLGMQKMFFYNKIPFFKVCLVKII